MANHVETNKVHHVITEEQHKKIEKLADTIRYGSITLVIQDGKLIQIDRNEKMRVTP